MFSTSAIVLSKGYWVPSFVLDAVGDMPCFVTHTDPGWCHSCLSPSAVLWTLGLGEWMLGGWKRCSLYTEPCETLREGSLCASHNVGMSNGDCSDHWCLEEEYSAKPVSVANSPSQISEQPNSCHYLQDLGCWGWSEFCGCKK